MTPSNHEQLPCAGDWEEKPGSNVFYLAPLPVPSGVIAASSRQLEREPNETFLDFANLKTSVEFGTRGGIGSIMCVTIFLMLGSLGLGLSDYIQAGRPIFEPLATLFSPNLFIWGLLGFLVVLHGWQLFQAIHQSTSYPPIRFNRQRREVAYVPKRGQPPRFVPWEEVIACVTTGQIVTQYGTHNSISLMIGLRDSDSGDVLWLTVPTGSLMLAVSEWEAIRVYMEEGPNALPQPMSEEHEEGTVAYFHFRRRVYRENHSYVRYLFGFMLMQFCSGWTLPCHIAAWVERLPKTSFPKSVIEWSKPLPPEQWQKPSEELIEQSKAVRESLRKGKSLFDHYRDDEKESNIV